MPKELSPETQFMVKVFQRKPGVSFKEMKALAEKAVAKGRELNLSKIIPVTYGVAKRSAGLTGISPTTPPKPARKPGRPPKSKSTPEPTPSPEPKPSPIQSNGVMGEINRLVSEHEQLKNLVLKFVGEVGAIIQMPTSNEEEEVF